MKNINRLIVGIGYLDAVIILFVVVACATMTLKDYPAPANYLYKDVQSVEGISVIVQPLLNEEDQKTYFGVNLLEKGILPIYLDIKNDSPTTSYMFNAESAKISVGERNDFLENPEMDDQRAGESAAVAANIISPIFMAVAAQQFSDASIIEENFESDKIRSEIIDPKERASGFLYFPWDESKVTEKTALCFQLSDLLAEKAYPLCLDINLRR